MNNQKGTPLRVFSIIQNCKSFNAGKDVDLDTIVNAFWYKKSPPFIKNTCKRIWNDIENSLYEYVDFKLFLLYNYIFIPKIDIRNIDVKMINTCINDLSLKRFGLDKELMLAINKRVKLKSIDEYFKINPGGLNYMHDLVIMKTISPITFLKLRSSLKLEEKSLYDESKIYTKFKRLVDEIKRQMTNDK